MDDKMEPFVNVLIYGLGAVGCFYGFVLKRNAPHLRLSVVARSNYEVVKEKGFVIKSENHGEHTVHPENVMRCTAEVTRKYEFVVCTAKALDQSVMAKDLEPVVDDDTTIVIIQNGVGNEDTFRAMYPSCTILSCVTWVSATQTSPGVVKQSKSERMEIGTFPNTSVPAEVEHQRLHRFGSLLAAGKTPVSIEPDIQTKRWKKVVWNAAWNSLTALTMLDTQAWLQSSDASTPLTRRVMSEVIEVANACCDTPIHDDDDNDDDNSHYGNFADKLMDMTVRLPGIQSSMMTDRKSGRQMEVEVILGTPVRKAREHGIPVPALETLYALLVAVNYGMRQAR